MLRIWKVYDLKLQAEGTAAPAVVFSGYPGLLSSVGMQRYALSVICTCSIHTWEKKPQHTHAYTRHIHIKIVIHEHLSYCFSLVISDYYLVLSFVHADDFYVTSQKLVVIETTNGIFNNSLYDLINSECVLSWIRVVRRSIKRGKGARIRRTSTCM